MCDHGRGLDGRTGVRQAQVVSGELQAGIDGLGGGGGVWVQAKLGKRTGGQTGKPTAQIEIKMKWHKTARSSKCRSLYKNEILKST